MQRSTSIVLNAPAEQIWDYIQDNATALDPAILAFNVQPAPGPGAVNRITFRGPLGLRLKAESRIDVWEPPHRYVVQSVKPSWPIRSRAEDVLDELDGATRYTVTITVQPRALARPIGRIWLRYIMRTREQMMSRLKDGVEPSGEHAA